MATSPESEKQAFLPNVHVGKSIHRYGVSKVIFGQGEAANCIFYIERGYVKLTVLSKRGKEAIVGLLGKGEFLGEACIAGELRRSASATAITACTIVRVEKAAAVTALQKESTFASGFLAYVLARNVRTQEDLVDQIVYSSEKRLARLLLRLAQIEAQSGGDKVTTQIDQTTLAEMVGTTRPRVSHFLNKFRKLGFIRADGDRRMNSAVLNGVLRD